eukprot:TRINITY_DN83899_c0_g1_i1.p1 TRINITY_DN83899_c0_g1~~TRINITY_DN83899_c0_g1_i1.p1  ORF type:complete len:128 (+),score=9.62 TRINITY_DN83899_c0_g1_i1:30-386(+)
MTLKLNVAMLAFVSVVTRVASRGAEDTLVKSGCEEEPTDIDVSLLGTVVALLLLCLTEAVRWVRELDTQRICILIAAVLCWTLLLDDRERVMMLCGAAGYLLVRQVSTRKHIAAVTCL